MSDDIDADDASDVCPENVNQTDRCQKPNCRVPPSNTYNGKHGNELRLCERHYYELVSGERSANIDIGVGTDPFVSRRPIELEGVDNRLESDLTGVGRPKIGDG